MFVIQKYLVLNLINLNTSKYFLQISTSTYTYFYLNLLTTRVIKIYASLGFQTQIDLQYQISI